MNVKLALILCGIALVTVLGCVGDPGPEGPVGPQGPQGEEGGLDLNIVAVMHVYEQVKAFNRGQFAMSIYNVPSIPKVDLNDNRLFLEDDSFFDEGRLAYNDTIILERDDSAFLDITYTKRDSTSGTASSDISLPSEFFAAASNISIDVGNDVEAKWRVSNGANAYWVYTYFYFSYLDTTDVILDMTLEFDTVLAADDTTLLIPGSAIFPDTAEIASVTGFDGYFQIRAVTGPWLPGESNNFTGDAFGVFTAVTPEVNIDVDLGPAAVPMIINGNDVDVRTTHGDEFFNRRIRELRYNRER
jgi:hypothetical protein